LIRRFIDPEAGFKFVSGKRYRPDKGELRFDMFEAECIVFMGVRSAKASPLLSLPKTPSI